MEETTLSVCRDCSAPARPNWQFCGSCGGRLCEPTPAPAHVPALAPEAVPVAHPAPSAEARFGAASPTTGAVPAALAAASSLTRLEALMQSQRAAVVDEPTVAPPLFESEREPEPEVEPALAPVFELPSVAAAGPRLSPLARIKALVPRPQVPRRAFVAMVVVVAVLAVAVVGALGVNDVSTHHKLASTRAELATTQRDLAAARAKIADITKQLDASKADLASTKSQLDAKTTELSGVRNSLNYANGQIDDLKTCLQGVLQADSYAADGDYTSALAALDAVMPVCQRVLRSV